MNNMTFISAICGGLGIFLIFGSLLPVQGGTHSSLPQSESQQSREKFELFRSRLETLKLKFEALDSKMDLILELLAEDGAFVKNSRGPVCDTSEKGQAGVPREQIVPSLDANLTGIAAELEDVEPLPTNVTHEATDFPTVVYIAGKASGIRVYNEADWRKTAILVNQHDSETYLFGVAWDDRNRQIYFCSLSKIYRMNHDGTGLGIVFNTTICVGMHNLAMDWMTGNLYGVGSRGFVFVCQTVAQGSISCRNLLKRQGWLSGITVDPNSGTMYWTDQDNHRIVKAEMDGTNAVEIVTGVAYPNEIVIDSYTWRLFWLADHQVQSSKLDGTDIAILYTSMWYPEGLAVDKKQVIIRNGSRHRPDMVISIPKSGGPGRSLGFQAGEIRQFALAAPRPYPTRRNHCEGRKCSGICVLTRKSSRCVP